MRKVLPVLTGIVMMACLACERSPNYYLSKGLELSAKKQYDEATLNFRKAIQKNPQLGEAYYQLGLMEIHLNEAPEALLDLSRAVDLMPARDEVKVVLGDFSFNTFMGDLSRPKPLYDKVAALADQFLEKDPNSYDGLRWKGNLAAVDKKLKVAQENYRMANAAKPRQPELLLSWTHVLFLDGQQAEGEKLARQLLEIDKSYGPIYDELVAQYLLIGKYAEAEETLKAKLNNNPTDAEAVFQLATFYAGASREKDMKAVLQRIFDNPAAFSRPHLRVGDFYERNQRWEDAIREYQQGAEANPRDKLLYLKRITNSWLAQGKGEQALEAVGEIRKREPHDEAAQAVQASLLLASGKPEAIKEAVSQFKSLVNRSPEIAIWRFNLGRALAAQGDAAGAKREYQDAARRNPSFVPPRLALAQQSAASGDYQGALQYTNDILAINPNLPTVRLLRAVNLVNTGNDEEARDELKNVQRFFPDEVQFQSAVLDLKARNFREAEVGFRKLLQKDHSNNQALAGLVHAETGQNQIARALPVLQEELDKSPSSEGVRLLLADVEVALGKFDAAIEEYRRLLAMNPRSAQYHLSLGRAYQLKGENPKAALELQEACKWAPKNPLPPALLAHSLLAAGKPREAVDSLRHALELGPDNASIMNDLAFLIAESGGNLNEALMLARKAVQAAREDPEMSDTLGWVYVKKNLNDSALQILRGLVAKYPQRPDFRYHLGIAFLQAGDDPAAKQEFKQALSMNPPAVVRQEIEIALARTGEQSFRK